MPLYSDAQKKAAVPPDPWLFERSLTIDQRFAIRLARAHFRYVSFTAGGLAPAIAVPIVILMLPLFIAHSVAAVVDTIWLPIAVLVLEVLAYLLVYRNIVTSTRRHMPVGTEIGLAFRSDVFRFATSTVSSEIAYSLYASIEEHADFVLVRRPRRRRAPGSAWLLSTELLTEQSLAYLKERVAIANR